MNKNKPAKNSARNLGMIQSLVAAPLIAALLIIAYAPLASAQTEDDLFLFTSSVSPNVLVQLDNSGSMNHIVWHPDFDPDGDYDCDYFDNYGKTRYITETWGYAPLSNGAGTYTFCGRTRTIYHDTASSGWTRYDRDYLNWVFSSQNTVQAEIDEDKEMPSGDRGELLDAARVILAYLDQRVRRAGQSRASRRAKHLEQLETENHPQTQDVREALGTE